MINSIELLVSEHENIKQALAVLRATSLRLMKSEAVDLSDLRDLVAFIREYADAIHHGKEEAFLFQEMVSELGQAGTHLIRNGMLVEHDLGRLYVSDLDAAILALEVDDCDSNRLDLIVAAGSYIKLLERHIEKENAAVFTFGDRALSDEAKHRIEKATNAFELDPENTKLREHHLGVLDKLSQKYL